MLDRYYLVGQWECVGEISNIECEDIVREQTEVTEVLYRTVLERKHIRQYRDFKQE